MRKIKTYWISDKPGSVEYLRLMVNANNKARSVGDENLLIKEIKTGCQNSLETLISSWEYMILMMAKDFETENTSINHLFRLGRTQLKKFVIENADFYSIEKLFSLGTFVLRKTYVMHKENRPLVIEVARRGNRRPVFIFNKITERSKYERENC